MLALLRAKARLILPNWPWIALFACALMLGAAHYFEKVQGLAPCLLCLKQREAYWVAGAVSLAAIAAGFTPWRRPLVRLLCAILALVFLYGMGMAIYHAGAEMKWWPGPQACASVRSGGVTDIEAMLAGVRAKPPSCEDPVWWFLGITMAGWNVIISLKLAVWSAAAAIYREPR